MADPNLKIRIETSADVSGAQQTQAALKGVGDEALRTESKIDRMFREVEAGVSKMEKDAGLMTPPPLPGGAGGKGGISGGDVFAASLGAEVALKGVVALIGATREFFGNLAEGAGKAAELGLELEGMDAAARQAAVAGMGPLGQLIAENSPVLAQFARDTAEIRTKMDDLWTAAGVQLVPALADLASGIAAIDTTKLGAEIGNVAGGAVVLVREVDEATRSLTGGAAGAGEITMGLLKLHPAIRDTALLFGMLSEKNQEFIEQQRNDPAVQAAQLAAHAEAVKKAEEELAAWRIENAKSTEEKIADLKTKQAASASGAEKIALEQEIAALQKKLDAQAAKDKAEADRKQAAVDRASQKAADDEERRKKEAEAEKKRGQEAVDRASEKAEREQLAADLRKEQLELTIKLNEAIAAGNKDEEEKVRWMQEYLRLQQQGASEEDAQRAANASSGARAAAAAGRGEAGVPAVSPGPDFQPTRPGELFSGTRRRRGILTSDSFEQSSGLGAGEAARPLTDFQDTLRARGSEGAGTQGGGPVPPGPGGDAGGGNKESGGGESDAKEAASAAKELKVFSAAFKQIAEALKALPGELKAGVASIMEAIKELRAEIEQMKRR